ncbi:hypothetical protein Lal_00050169 [Lupinus albus]|uniref:Uncharacterized protein n=1 Tax=Lupinus albus TaxID=3870 RepID=A0A6A4PLZ8_LUPAL|nr:hypothetical protein Lalb_Chr12g0199761 [Lupinus albus]KAF1867736.1 hypothetical protein Lal_00050169 [Lupinus albus]
MDLWRKIRRNWIGFSIRIKLRKSSGEVGGGRGSGGGKYGGGDNGRDGCGLVKLRDDVEMCGYKDVEVMWNMLSIGLQPEQMETAPSTSSKLPKRRCKYMSIP